MTDYTMPTDALRYWASNDPTKRAIVFRGDAVTYRELDAWVSRFAWRLVDAGVKVGDRVGVIGENTIEWCVAGLATLKVGAIHAALNNRMVPAELVQGIEMTDTTLVVTADSHRDRMEEVASLRSGVQLMAMENVAAVRHGDRQPFRSPEVEADDVAMIVYSSGSTGMPKGIIYSNRTILSYITEWALMEPAMGREARILLPQPLAGMGGFGNAILRSMVVGGSLFLEPRLDPPEALRLLIEERCNSLMAVPIIFQRISLLPEFEHADLSSLKFAIIGGAPVPLEEFDKWHARGASLRQVYGSTEAGGAWTAMSVEGAREHPDRCGRGGIFRQIRIVRTDGKECDAGEDGEILVRGPSVTPGYWNHPEATAALLDKDGWLHTGDLGQLDETGLLKVTDRIKEIIISGGFNIGPTEIENCVLELDGVTEVAAYGVPDERFGETVAVIVNIEGNVTADDIVQHCNKRLSDFKVPRYVVIAAEPFPRSHEGKIAKVPLRQLYADRLAEATRVR